MPDWEDEEALAFDADVERIPWRCRCTSCRQRLGDAPCARCGYNGPGYYQPETHPCAKEHQ